MFHSPSDIVRVESHNEYNASELYYCDMCTADGWFSETEVEIHKISKHKKQLKANFDDEDFVCGLCCTVFVNHDELLRHLKSEHLYSSEDAYRVEHEIFVCNHCCQVFFNKLHLIVHIYQKHGTQQTRRVQCPYCKRVLQCRQVWFHAEKHMTQSISTCRICFIKCKNRKALREHLRLHTKYLKCEICGYTTKQSSLFNEHIRTLHKYKSDLPINKKIKRYFIPKADEASGRSQILVVYKGLSLTNSIRICILCREICIGYDNMKNHIYNEHNFTAPVNKNQYKCACGEKFNNKVLLKHHVFKLKGDHHIC